MMLCCPGCVVQYCDAKRDSADIREQDLRAYEKSVHLFIGEEKTWS